MQPQTPFRQNAPQKASPTSVTEKLLLSVPKKSSGAGETRFSKIEIHMARYLLQCQKKVAYVLHFWASKSIWLESGDNRFCVFAYLTTLLGGHFPIFAYFTTLLRGNFLILY